MNLDWAIWIPWLPLIGTVICVICSIARPARQYASWAVVACLLGSFGLTVGTYFSLGDSVRDIIAFEWLRVNHTNGAFSTVFGYYLDSLTVVMLLVVTGIGTLIATYAAGYMKGDRGYARFFAFVGIFIFAMTTLVMADNLVLLFLGWEGVGLASYLLIGFYYKKPSAVAAAKKAFIVNRIGDFGFALGIFAIYYAFGSVMYADIIPAAQAMLGQIPHEMLTGSTLDAYNSAMAMQEAWPNLLLVTPFLLMIGAFGKSAQLPLYVWLPDAMEGPTPVSALIHAATMVTSGVYMIARLIAIFELSPYALPTVATVGGITCFFAATIAVTQYDIKRVFAYSTVSQLGYMFLGVGVLCTTGAVFHLMTHAFFKALLFLTCGNVMHAMAGQLDLRKMSGMGRIMPATKWLMLCGCLALSAVPLTSGFFSKDLILYWAINSGMQEGGNPLFLWLGVLGLVAAFFTVCYAFRVWFRVFCGPTEYTMGDEVHEDPDADPYGDEHGHGHDQAGHDEHAHHHAPHEMPWLPMNAPLVVLALGAIFAGWLGVGFDAHAHGWIGNMIEHSSANPAGYVPPIHLTQPHGLPVMGPGPASIHAGGGHAAHAEHHVMVMGMSLHWFMNLISALIAGGGILLAWYLHLVNRAAAAKLRSALGPLSNLLYHKYYVDELYRAMFVLPLRAVAWLMYYFDHYVIDGIIAVIGVAPKIAGRLVRPTQSGLLQGYGVGMLIGVTAILILILMSTGPFAILGWFGW